MTSGANTSGRGQPDIKRPLDISELDSEASEFSWGSGLTPKGRENAAPAEGGRYRGTSPPCDPVIGVSSDPRI